jgi:hypothetical protein
VPSYLDKLREIFAEYSYGDGAIGDELHSKRLLEFKEWNLLLKELNFFGEESAQPPTEVERPVLPQPAHAHCVWPVPLTFSRLFDVCSCVHRAWLIAQAQLHAAGGGALLRMGAYARRRRQLTRIEGQVDTCAHTARVANGPLGCPGEGGCRWGDAVR